MTDDLPPLADGDVYLYAHGNGGIGVVHGDGRSLGVTLDDALATARGVHDVGCRVVVGGDDAPLAVDTLARLGALGVPLEPFAAAAPPVAWLGGTTALMEAAAHGNDRVLDDLIARGADVHHRDESGSTALHHAAASGNLHAIDALVAAGAEVDRPNTNGFTPRATAVDRGQDAAARRLGADRSTQVFEFGRSHYGVVYGWFVVPVLVVVAFALTWPPSLVELGIVVGFYAVVARFVAPPLAFWAGGVARRLAGTELVLRRTTGPLRAVDLARTTVVAMGGSTSPSGYRSGRWILLGHPDGHPVTRRTLARLLVAPAELDALLARTDRAIVLALDGPHRGDVLVPLGATLESMVPGADLLPSFRSQHLERRAALRG